MEDGMKKTVKSLDAKDLCKKAHPEYFKFKTTAEIQKRSEFVGQQRAVDAVLWLGREIASRYANTG